MTSGARPLDRRTALKTLGLAAAVGLSEALVACDDAPPRQPARPPLLDLGFRVQHQYRPLDLVSPGFATLDQPSPLVLSGAVIVNTPLVAPSGAIELTVDAAGGADTVVGLFRERNEWIAAVFSPRRGEVRVEVRTGGNTQVVATARVDLPKRFKAAFAVCENQATALADTGHGWEPLVTNRDQVAGLVDLRDPATLASFRLACRSGTSGGDVRVSDVKAGPFGMVGLRDPHVVQHPDGRPYVRGGKVYLTFTCAGLGFFQQAHWGVFTLDLHDPRELHQVAHLYTARDGLLLGDHAGQIIVDDANSRFIVLNTSWGDFDGAGVHVRHAVTSDDVLSGVHLLKTEQLDLPTRVSSWDPGASLIDGRWHVSFVESPSQDPFVFHPALAAGRTGAAYDAGLRMVGSDTSLHQCEGPILQRVGDTWYLLASDGDARTYRVYDLTMRRLGNLRAPYGSNIPHPQLVPRPGGGFLMVTFDGTQYGEDVLGYGTHGDVVILSSHPR